MENNSKPPLVMGRLLFVLKLPIKQGEKYSLVLNGIDIV
jgi:hypothetical protein